MAIISKVEVGLDPHSTDVAYDRVPLDTTK